MSDRIRLSIEKKKPGLAFILPLDITFSLSVDYETAKNFKLAAGNRNDDVSHILREMVFKKLGFKNKREFDSFMESTTKQARESIYQRMDVSRQNSFSKQIIEEVKKYLKNAT